MRAYGSLVMYDPEIEIVEKNDDQECWFVGQGLSSYTFPTSSLFTFSISAMVRILVKNNLCSSPEFSEVSRSLRMKIDILGHVSL